MRRPRGQGALDTLATAPTNWSTYLEQTIVAAQQTEEIAEEFAEDIDVPQLAFEVVALLEMANAESVPHDEFAGYDKAATAILDRLRGDGGCRHRPGGSEIWYITERDHRTSSLFEDKGPQVYRTRTPWSWSQTVSRFRSSCADSGAMALGQRTSTAVTWPVCTSCLTRRHPLRRAGSGSPYVSVTTSAIASPRSWANAWPSVCAHCVAAPRAPWARSAHTYSTTGGAVSLWGVMGAFCRGIEEKGFLAA
ncbi:hypothetical protein [Streptomyces sp. NPDC048641]|uniref:TetR family transcriptional regulator C-terminal domain-containing protein n=1 Tax=Streptomyces sp. NPDC048641 TaxID=3154825 RepID=UPI00344168E7